MADNQQQFTSQQSVAHALTGPSQGKRRHAEQHAGLCLDTATVVDQGTQCIRAHTVPGHDMLQSHTRSDPRHRVLLCKNFRLKRASYCEACSSHLLDCWKALARQARRRPTLTWLTVSPVQRAGWNKGVITQRRTKHCDVVTLPLLVATHSIDCCHREYTVDMFKVEKLKLDRSERLKLRDNWQRSLLLQAGTYARLEALSVASRVYHGCREVPPRVAHPQMASQVRV